MNILEKEIEELIFDALVENPSLLQEKGLDFHEHRRYVRQPELGAYGRPDVIGYTINQKWRGIRPIGITVFEFKKDVIDINTLMQAARYRTAAEQFVRQLGLSHLATSVDIILIGKHIQMNGDFVFTLDLCPHRVSAYTYKLNLTEGLTFEHHIGYTNRDPNFKKLEDYNYRKVKKLLETHNPSLTITQAAEF